jgi:hypothetical protein
MKIIFEILSLSFIFGIVSISLYYMILGFIEDRRFWKSVDKMVDEQNQMFLKAIEKSLIKLMQDEMFTKIFKNEKNYKV